jgi:5-methylcytosine-specific restriction endonuclease McrA
MSASALHSNVLVLNQHFRAVHVTTVRRAFALLCKSVAEVVHWRDHTLYTYNFESWKEVSQFRDQFEPYDDWIRTVSFEIAVPRIIRLLLYANLPPQEVKFNRRNIYARDGNRCQYCGRKHPTTELSLDHVVPKSKGGRTTWSNVVCACTSCNNTKAGRTPREASMTLIRPPARPHRNPVIQLKIRHEKYRSWKQFLGEAYWTVELKE